MSITKQKQLLAPLTIGSIEIPNRVVFGAHPTNFAEKNIPGERHLHYYEERARGGAGLIIVEEGYVHESDFPYEYAILAYKPEVTEGYRQLTDAVHKYGTKIFAQLGHSGSQADSSLSQRELWSPSGFQTDAEVPKIMEQEDIQAVVRGFVTSSRHVKEAGVDGIELNGGQRSLIRQFMSGLTNHRQDEYGGTLENRLRFVREIIAAIRKEVGRDFPIGLRVTVDEYAPWAGITPEEAEEIVHLLTVDGMLDFFSTSVGSIYSTHMTRPSMYVSQGFAADYTARIKAVSNLPVMGGGRIVHPEQAESFLEDRKMDFVEMTRAQIADPALVTKYKDNQIGRIRPCIGCNQECSVYGSLNRKISCIHNAAAGYEKELGASVIKPSRNKKKVMVIGGGPAGLEAARIAAIRGHHVSVYDGAGKLGGQVNTAMKGPGREEIAGVVRYLENELRHLGVDIYLNTYVDKKQVVSAAADTVILATGSVHRLPHEYEGGSLPHVITGFDAWNGADIGDNVVIVDEVGSYQSTTLIEKIAREGKNVTAITSELFVGVSLAQTLDISLWNQRVYSLGVTMIPRSRIKKITERDVHIFERFSKVESVLREIDTVIFCLPELPQESLYYEIKDSVRQVFRVGDCVAPRGIGMAIVEGNQVGRRV